ncbi:MAG: nucleotidyltransferase domain-containing protein [Candidatus Korarchaeota archaeon]|nr:nucleotidyltransferase domain-containing protein [Candidatus Korarchaeota archaeon]
MQSKRYDLRVIDTLRDYRKVAKSVKEIVKRFDPEAEVYVFGSVVRGEYTGASDIDIMVVTERLDIKYDIMVEVYREVEAPVELHVVSRRQLERWYKRFIPPDEMEKV